MNSTEQIRSLPQEGQSLRTYGRAPLGRLCGWIDGGWISRPAWGYSQASTCTSVPSPRSPAGRGWRISRHTSENTEWGASPSSPPARSRTQISLWCPVSSYPDVWIGGTHLHDCRPCPLALPPQPDVLQTKDRLVGQNLNSRTRAPCPSIAVLLIPLPNGTPPRVDPLTGRRQGLVPEALHRLATWQHPCSRLLRGQGTLGAGAPCPASRPRRGWDPPRSFASQIYDRVEASSATVSRAKRKDSIPTTRVLRARSRRFWLVDFPARCVVG